jgi:hypothetical protein
MRVARVQISKQLFESVLKAEFGHPSRVYETNAPKDLEVLGFSSSKENPFVFEALVKSKAFDDIAEGAIPPLIQPFIYTMKEVEF